MLVSYLDIPLSFQEEDQLVLELYDVIYKVRYV